MPSYLDASGRTVPPHIAIDASGRVKPGYREAADMLREGEHMSFSIMHMDAAAKPGTVFLLDSSKPYEHKPFISPSQVRQAEILADVARTDAARQIIRDAFIGEQVAAASADRSTGKQSEVVVAMRDARYDAAQPCALPQAASFSDNSHVAATLRFSRYS